MRMKWLRRTIAALGVAGALVMATGAAAAPAAAGTQPATNTWFICPTVSVNSPNGMWVIGYHGGYYVLVPTNNTGTKDYLTVPVQVFSLAQIPAGWGLYSSLPNYPNFVGTAVILDEGIEHWLGITPGDLGGDPNWDEGDMVAVTSNGDGTYTVADMRSGATVTLTSPIPLASDAVW
jgi:hypothetical protein